MKAAILGTGFPALIAAHAIETYCDTLDQPDPEIVLYGDESPPPARQGARWYERHIPGITAGAGMVKTKAFGEVDDYIAKINGPITEYNRPRPDFYAYDYHGAHLFLYKRFAPNMTELGITPKNIHEFSWSDCDFVFSTLPRPMFYSQNEAKFFAATRHWRLDEPENEQRFAQGNVDQNICIYDGTTDNGWYRVMQTFGLISVEWPYEKKPPLENLYTEILPLSASPELKLRNVDPHWRATETAFAHVGPVAKWQPSTDLAEVYFDVMRVLRGEFNGSV